MKHSEPSTKLKFASKSKPGLVVKMAALQFLVTIVFSLVLYICFDMREAISAFLGGVVVVLANLFFASRLFATKKNISAEQMLLRFYVSVVFKVIFTLMMMAICIIVIKVSISSFIIAFLLTAVVTNWLFILMDAKLSGD